MLIRADLLKNLLRIRPSGILHVGAHRAEELSYYSSLGWQDNYPTIWVEAQTELATWLSNTLDEKKNIVISAAVWDVDNQIMELKISSNSQSTSLLAFDTHLESYPDIKMSRQERVVTSRLDSLLSTQFVFDFINLDIQGVELRALKSLGSRLESINWIYTEVNRLSVYKDCDLVTELDKFLLSRDFRRVMTVWTGDGWGDAVYIHKRKVPPLLILRVLLCYFAHYAIRSYNRAISILRRTFCVVRVGKMHRETF